MSIRMQNEVEALRKRVDEQEVRLNQARMDLDEALAILRAMTRANTQRDAKGRAA